VHCYIPLAIRLACRAKPGTPINNLRKTDPELVEAIAFG
jgi:hypothetical protein